MENSFIIEVAHRNQGSNEHPCVVCKQRIRKGDLTIVFSRHSIPNERDEVKLLVSVKAHLHCLHEITRKYPKQTVLQ